jgi:hypothetical protein
MMNSKKSKTSSYYKWLDRNRKMENEQKEKFIEDLKAIRGM